ncbi:ATP synthase subunit b [Thiomicrorhabdus immobilis]|uniref:ATP synthase subunit b n=1 Tax=Thiomicrorhabdus immobilis TaxID=2791037 RepID=A0ABM7MFE0_9GAMM|nr:F0F1 ATP synthase subunit delta [Thiomicrorhabdus immobilis]BCN94091.1 ATP synthase subunit b [Thiomicrorhabdus immobilis]
MEFNTSTFILEIINFLVLMWVLKHFFYRPVLEVIEKRRLKIEQATLKAEKLNEDANALQQSYQNRLNAWEQDKQRLRDAFLQEIETERAQKMQKLQADLTLAQERAEVIQQHEQAELLKRTQQQAHQQAARFAAKLLKGAACLEMQGKLIELFIAQLTHMQQQADVDSVLLPLRQACEKSLQTNTPLKVQSAFPLTSEQQQQLQRALSPICEDSEHWSFVEEPSLLAGLRICLGDLALGINLQDELSGFTNLTLASAINIAPTETQFDDLEDSNESNESSEAVDSKSVTQ